MNIFVSGPHRTPTSRLFAVGCEQSRQQSCNGRVQVFTRRLRVSGSIVKTVRHSYGRPFYLRRLVYSKVDGHTHI